MEPDAGQWSGWLDFGEEAPSGVPDKPGVIVMHAAMKILYIGGAASLREEVGRRLEGQCTGKASRFKYMLTQEYQKTAEDLLADYRERHGGALPGCM